LTRRCRRSSINTIVVVVVVVVVVVDAVVFAAALAIDEHEASHDVCRPAPARYPSMQAVHSCANRIRPQASESIPVQKCSQQGGQVHYINAAARTLMTAGGL